MTRIKTLRFSEKQFNLLNMHLVQLQTRAEKSLKLSQYILDAGLPVSKRFTKRNIKRRKQVLLAIAVLLTVTKNEF